MKKLLIACLVAGMLASPFPVTAAEVAGQAKAAQLQAQQGSIRDDVTAMRHEMERLSDEAGALAGELQDKAQKEAALKIQLHVTSLIQRADALEKKLNAETGGVMASFSEGAGQAGNEKAKQEESNAR